MRVDQREAQLTALARQGDIDAYGDLYELYLKDVYRFVFYRVSNKEDAEDLTEQVFLKAWENLPNYRGGISFKAWLYRIARNATVDHYRTRKQDLSLDEDVPIPDGNEEPEEQAAAQETSARLIGSISKLSPLHQEVIILRFVNGLSATETAEILDRSAGSVRVLQHRALKTLQAFLTAEETVHG
jgi:RNA polymerase sigma-70 factor (ECF subfamily)